MIKKTDWQAAYRDLIAEGRQRLGEPPTAEAVLAYYRHELAEDEAAVIREFLVYYPELARVLEEPFPFPCEERPGAAEFLSEEDLGRHWASLRARVQAANAAAVASAPPFSRQLQHLPAPAVVGAGARRRWSWAREIRSWQLSAVAAALLAILFGGLYLQAQRELRRQEKELREPRFNIEHRLLLPDGQRGAATQQPPIPLPSEAENFLLIPALINHPQFPDYGLEIQDLSGTPPRPIWSGRGLRRRSDDTFEIWVPRAFLKPGRYRLVVYGLDAGRKEPLASYTVRLSPG